MKKLFMLALANIRKTKANTVTMLILFAITTLLLNAGLLVLINFGGFFAKTIAELNTSDAFYIVSESKYTKEVDDFIKENENVEKMQQEKIIWAKAEIEFQDEIRPRVTILKNADLSRDLSKWKFVGKHLDSSDNSVYLPQIFHKSGGYKLNDNLEITIKDQKFSFIIKGFYEDIYFSSFETGVIGLYFPEETYKKISEELDESYNARLVYVNLKEINKDVETGIRELSGAKPISSTGDIKETMFSMDVKLVSLTRTFMANVTSAMMVMFAMIIGGVCLLVIRFRIHNTIEEDMMKIGSLKAMGYTSGQIISSFVIQFFTIAFFGSVLGIAMSYISIPVLSDVFAQQSGLTWVQGFDANISSVTIIFVITIVVLVTYITSRRVNKLNPIIALRGGLITHSFKRNYLPLKKAKGNLSIILALKHIFHNLNQSIMIIIILIVTSFAGTFAVVMFYNTTIDDQVFKETPGLELSNVIAVLNPDIDNTQLIHNIRYMKDVRKVQFIDQVFVKIGNNEINAIIMDDYKNKETNTIYEGIYPRHDNEIAISGYLADMINISIGDTVLLEVGNRKEEFLITGFTQGASMMGMNVSLTTEGFQKLNPDFKQQSLQIYLNKGTDTGKFVNELDNLYGDTILDIVDFDKEMELGAGVYSSIVSKVGIVILVVAVSVVILVLYFVISSSIIHRRNELGIQKAIGFTTFQLMNQFSLGFILPVIIGVIIGSILGVTQTNPLMSIFQRGMGIMRAQYIIVPVWIIMFGIAITVLSYITSMLLTYRIRKISAYSLVNE